MRKIPIFRTVIIALVAGLGVCAFFAFRTLSDDQHLFVMELNHTLLQSTTTRVKSEMKTRLTELETFIPRVFAAAPKNAYKKENFFADLRPQLRDELVAVTFFRLVDNTKIEVFRQYRNQRTLKKRHLGPEALTSVFQTRPVALKEFYENKKLILMNRSIRATGKKGEVEFNLITIVMDGAFIPGAPPGIAVVVDLAPDFLRAILRDTEIADIFLVFADGKMFCHTDPVLMREYSERPLNHPMIARLKSGPPVKEALEMKAGDSYYFVSAAESGFENIYAITQTKKNHFLLIARILMGKGAALGMAALGLLLVLVVIVAKVFKRGPKKASADQDAPAADRRVAERRAAERRTATPKSAASRSPSPEEAPGANEILSSEESRAHLYFPGADSPSALTGVRQTTEHFEFHVGEVRPAELPKNLIRDALDLTKKALAEAAEKKLGPGDTLAHCNAMLHGTFRGRLFLTLAIGHLDLITGKFEIATAGHPPPLRFKPVSGEASSSDKEDKRKIEVLLARGERLGTKAEVGYPSVVYQLEPGDRLLAFTQGSVEAKNRKGEPWGTEGIAGAFLSGVESGGGLPKVAGALEAHVSGGLPRGDWAILWIEWNRRLAESPQETALLADEPVARESIPPETRQEYLYTREIAAEAETETILKKAA